MKSLFLAMLVIVSATSLFAGKEPVTTGLVVVPVKSNDLIKVIYKSNTISKVKLSVYNSAGAIVYSDVISGTDGFMCPLNFAGMSSGNYTVELTDSTGKKTQKFYYAAR